MTCLFDPSLNTLLAALGGEALERLAPDLEPVRLERGDTLHEMYGAVRQAHFPLTALISGFVDTSSGASAEVALIGSEGGLGLLTALSGVRGNFRAVVDSPGGAYRVRLEALRAVLAAQPDANRACLRYVTARTAQVAVNAVCNAHHSVQQRFCRALLMRLQRRPASTLYVTHTMMAEILGVRRTGITKVAAELRRHGAVDYARGKLMVVDQELLQQHACACERSIEAQTALLVSES